MVQPFQAHSHGKNDNNGKGWYFSFEDDNKVSYKYILPISQIWMGRYNTQNLIKCSLLYSFDTVLRRPRRNETENWVHMYYDVKTGMYVWSWN